MFGPAALLRGGNALAGRFAENTFPAGLGRGDRRGGGRRGGGRGPASELAANMLDLRLNFVALLLEMTQSVLEYGGVLIRFSSCHGFSLAHYIMDITQLSQLTPGD